MNNDNYALSGHRHRGDVRLLLSVGLLLLIGLIVIYSISPALSYRLFSEYRGQHFLFRQLLHISFALAAFSLATRVPLPTWRRLTKTFAYAAVAANLLVLVPGLGVTINGATRWLNIGIFSTFQPSELLKLAVIFIMADQLAGLRSDELNDRSNTMKPAIWLLVVSGFLVALLQKDMGTMLIITGIVGGLLVAGGVGWKHLSQFLAVIGAAGIAAVVAFPYRLTRLLTFFQGGQADSQGSGYHVSQSLIAVGSGGLTGLGLGKSLQVYGYLPEAANDSIFAVFAEKFGFVGSVIVLVIFGMLLQRILSIAMRAPDTYSSLVAAGIMIWIASHIMINIGAMLALLPLTGVTLPFLSLGGSSLLLMMFGIGLVYQISRYSNYRVGDPILAPLTKRVRPSRI